MNRSLNSVANDPVTGLAFDVVQTAVMSDIEIHEAVGAIGDDDQPISFKPECCAEQRLQ